MLDFELQIANYLLLLLELNKETGIMISVHPLLEIVSESDYS